MLLYYGSTVWETLIMLSLIGKNPVNNQSDTILARNFKHEKVISVGDSRNFGKDFFLNINQI